MMITREEYEANKVVLEGAPKCGKATHWSLENGYWMIRADGAWLWADTKFIPYTSAGIYFRSLDDLRKINAAYEREQWISVEDRLPESGKKVVAFYKNELGKNRQVFAYHIAKHELEATTEEDYADYCAEKDCYFDPPGWYECIENWEDYTHVFMYQSPIHWMPLPQPPQEGE